MTCFLFEIRSSKKIALDLYNRLINFFRDECVVLMSRLFRVDVAIRINRWILFCRCMLFVISVAQNNKRGINNYNKNMLCK